MHVTLLEDALKNSQDVKFYVMCFYHSKKYITNEIRLLSDHSPKLTSKKS